IRTLFGIIERNFHNSIIPSGTTIYQRIAKTCRYKPTMLVCTMDAYEMVGSPLGYHRSIDYFLRFHLYCCIEGSIGGSNCNGGTCNGTYGSSKYELFRHSVSHLEE